MGGHTWESEIMPTRCRRHLRPAFGGGRRGHPGAIAADNATTTYFESINYWKLAACISYTEEVS